MVNVGIKSCTMKRVFWSVSLAGVVVLDHEKKILFVNTWILDLTRLLFIRDFR